MTIHSITLGELLTSNNVLIARHARGVLAELNKHKARLELEQDKDLGIKTADKAQAIKTTVVPEHTITCPLCGSPAPYKLRAGVHTWICIACPFYAIEKY